MLCDCSFNNIISIESSLACRTLIPKLEWLSERLLEL